MKKRIIDDDNPIENADSGVTQVRISVPSVATGIEKQILPSGLFLYRYRLASFPPSVRDHDTLNSFLGHLIPKLMVATSSRMEPFVCLDGRHLNDELFGSVRESGVTWRPLLGFPVIPGFHPFRYLPIAYHIAGREAWNEVADQFLGTGGTGIFLTPLPADEFLTRLVQLVFTQNSRASTELFPVYLPDAMLSYLRKAAGASLKPLLECFQFYLGENAAETAVEIVSVSEIEGVVKAAFENSNQIPARSET